MFEYPTVLIVGAGGSADFGAPTGRKILDDLLSEPLDRDLDRYHPQTDLFTTDFLNFLRFNEFHREKQAIRELIDKARGSVAQSIDLFAYQNEDVLEVSKLYSTWKILGGLYETHHDHRNIRPPYLRPTYLWRQPRIKKASTWIAHLARKFMDDCDNCADLGENKLSIVTFNYDTILEDALHHLICRPQRYAYADKSALPKVHHVFGKLPDFKEDISCSDIFNASKAIRYMYESNSPETIDDNLQNIRPVIKKAAYIYILGFDVNPRNAELIELGQSKAKKFALNFDGNPGLQSRLLKLGLEAEHVRVGRYNDPLYANIACDHGFFDLADLYPKPEYTIHFV